jgi:hypothetical protein
MNNQPESVFDAAYYIGGEKLLKKIKSINP